MVDHTMILNACSVVAVLLTIYKVATRPQSEKTEGNSSMGGAMTIGDREVQEDAYLFKENKEGKMMVLCDGMGEVFGGRIAAKTAAEVFGDLFDSYNALDNPSYFFKKAFHTANKSILKALDNGQNGTASVGAVIVLGNQLFYAVVGNVKISVYRKNDLVPISTGHTINAMAQKKFESGTISREEAVRMLENKRLYNYLGQDGFEDIELFDEPIALEKGDYIVMMSDGVYEILTWQEVEEVMKTDGDCNKMAVAAIEKVNQSKIKDKDNASIVLMRTGDR